MVCLLTISTKPQQEFFTDNATSTVGVLDGHNTVRKVAASGTRMFTPEIPGVGRLRMRYPIMPTHAEGSGTEKEVDALKDMVMNMQTYGKYFDHDPNPTDPPHDRHDQHYVTSTTHLAHIHAHYHDIYLTPEELQQLRHHHTVFTYTGHAKDDNHSPLDGHQHAVEIENNSAVFMAVIMNGYASDLTNLKTLAGDQANTIKALKKSIEELGRQIMYQQEYVEERIRSDGASGLKQKRATHKGTRDYFTDSFGYSQIAAVHDHSNYDRTVGMGELNAVLNGVDFRTRHNDYKLYMPSLTKPDYHKTEPIPFPPVPPSVSAKHSIADQIQEMREYFKAFKDQNRHHRNYVPYFKPLLCYLEGAWTTDTKSLTEPFHSDRHFLDAASWFDLQTKVRYTSSTGGKSNSENYSYLPTKITAIKNGTVEYAQWNYRIVCHPIKTNHFSRLDLQKVNDVAQKFAMGKTEDDLAFSRIPRFTFVAHHKNRVRGFNGTKGYVKEAGQAYEPGLLDIIMQEIPGVDNYMAKLNDPTFGYTIQNIFNGKPLNTGYYHRWYKIAKNGKVKTALRGFADPNLFVAQTTSPRVAPVSVTDCHYNETTHKKDCHNYTARYTYAVPLELIWLSPLYTWNPYNLQYYNTSTSRAPANYVTKDGRDGGLNKTSAYNGTNNANFYFTPAEFFHGGEVSRDPADTAKDVVGVLDKHGNVRHVVASGTKIILPEIPGVGKLRMRYQIVPVHGEGSATWKELNALKELMMDMPHLKKFFETDPQPTPPTEHDDIHLKTSSTFNGIHGVHQHDVYLTTEEVNALSNHKNLNTTTTEVNGHYHNIVVQYHNNIFRIASCDGLPHCADGHTGTLHREAINWLFLSIVFPSVKLTTFSQKLTKADCFASNSNGGKHDDIVFCYFGAYREK
ncbi:hypothetical protein KUTeg_005131 [Tegillarca granosa]|uniref:Uncharacterized protein n=1 Tax=Tegillarca granosa TaxID=220873 RepID=A0ABQ9FIW1_TEGGR|nr:hypothetical protein KUTeg_005131 [Tegillarca granosa]